MDCGVLLPHPGAENAQQVSASCPVRDLPSHLHLLTEKLGLSCKSVGTMLSSGVKVSALCVILVFSLI